MTLSNEAQPVVLAAMSFAVADVNSSLAVEKPAAYALVTILCPPDNKSYRLVFFANNSLRNLTIKSIGDLLNCLDIPCYCLINQGIRDSASFNPLSPSPP